MVARFGFYFWELILRLSPLRETNGEPSKAAVPAEKSILQNFSVP